MTAWAALVLLAQDPLAELDSASPAEAYRAIERLAGGGPDVRALMERRMPGASGRLKTHLRAALDGPVAPLRRVTLPAGPRGVVELLRDLSRQAGLPIDDEPLGDEKLPDVAVDVRDLPPFEALEAICRAAELWPSWDDERITLHTGGFVAMPSSRFGPFLLRISQVRHERSVEFVAPAVETLSLDVSLVFEHGLPVLCVAGLDVLEARDESGADLVRPAERIPGPAAVDPEPPLVAAPDESQDASMKAQLRPLSKGARSLALLRGTFRVRLPRKTRAVEIARPEPGATGSTPGLAVKVRDVRRDESRLLVDVEIGEPALARRSLLVTGYLGEGRRELTHTVVLETPREGLRRLAVAVRPRKLILTGEEKAAGGPLLDRLRIEVVEDVVERALPFEFRGVPLR
jgi:hypothetical protein